MIALSFLGFLGVLIPTIYAFHAIHLGIVDDLYTSPCSDTFNYIRQDGVLQYGIIKVDCPDCTNIQLHVELSVGNQVQGYNGELLLAASKDETIQNILQRKPIMYKIIFPRWFNYPPKVTKVILNGQLVCQGPPIDIKAVRILTTINLHHTLKLNISPGWGNYPTGRLDPMTNYASTGTSSQPEISIIDFNPVPPMNIFPRTTTTEQPAPMEPLPSRAPPTETFIPTGDLEPASGKVFSPHPIPDRRGFNNWGLNDDSCGIRVNSNMLVANGRNVQKGVYPWLVAIFEIKTLGPEFRCGATLISHKHIITAGHCVKQGSSILSAETIFMRVGEHNIRKWTSVTGSRLVGAERVLVHSDYKAMSADGDIAMILLGEKVAYTKLIRPICLWRGDTSLDKIVGFPGIVVGWGKDEHDNLITPEPKQVLFPVVSQEDCLRSHFTFREITSERTFCAGYKNGSGPCNGDSGGGFIMELHGRWYLRGIVSMSIAKDRSCDFSQYFVFSDVTKFQEWIVSNL